MPSIQGLHDSLPYIDQDITPETRSRIFALLAVELPQNHTDTLHPLIPAFPSLKLSPIINAELDRVAAKQPITAIDTTRYEALEAPPYTDPTSCETRPQLLDDWRSTLQKSYTSSTYLSTRLQNLALLERFGKNAWLISNSQLEDILKGIEKELVETKEQVEEVNSARQRLQESVKGEIEGMDEGWRKGVGRLVEVQVGVEQVRREILEKRREGAV